ncbi:MAG: OmpA family protein [Bacteroidota bacterium]|nr:OmpA family protein [Bacteroidota bacterium]
MKFKFTFVVLLAILLWHSALAQDTFSPFYVVIGGFQSEENAQKYCTYAHEQNFPAVYAFNEERQLYYVYVRATQTKDIANEILARLKEDSVFKDAWVFNGVLSGSTLARRPKTAPVESKPASEPKPSFEPAPVLEKPVEKSPPKDTKPAPQDQVAAEVPKPVGRPFIFKLISGETGSPLNGLVRLQESDRASQFRGYNGNEKVYVPAPTNRSGKWYIVCQVLGFRQLKKPIVYGKASEIAGASIGPDQEIVIPLELERVRRGDYIEMENVKFYNNTALLAPGSERELDELVAMMEENPDYHIKLHGHTNGKQARDIVSIGTSNDFFTPSVLNAKSHASAQQLSLLRAELIKAYLANKGIDPSRIVTKGEGGTQMIFDPSGTLAGLNDRVEVEIRKN